MSADRLTGLDALRGVAAVCVVLFHLWPQLLVNGYLAVDVFFMISGYVMARTFEPQFATGLTAGKFLRARYLRLWPTMALGGLLLLPFFLQTHGVSMIPVAVANLLMVPVPMLGIAFVLNSPAWSIFFELLANWLHGAVLWRMTTVRLAILVAAMSAVLALIAAFWVQSLEVGMLTNGFWAGVPRVLMGYCAGMLMWRLWRECPPLAVPPLVGLAMLPAYLVANGFQGGSRWPVDLLFVLAGGPIALAGALRFAAVPRWLAWLGAISFPLYAVHFAAIAAIHALGLGNIAALVASLATASAVAAIEPAFRRALFVNQPRAVAH